MEILAAVPAGSFGIADGARIVVANLYIES
jgi:hypothetical protein